jgi:hypothetical protein
MPGAPMSLHEYRRRHSAREPPSRLTLRQRNSWASFTSRVSRAMEPSSSTSARPQARRGDSWSTTASTTVRRDQTPPPPVPPKPPGYTPAAGFSSGSVRTAAAADTAREHKPRSRGRNGSRAVRKRDGPRTSAVQVKHSRPGARAEAESRSRSHSHGRERQSMAAPVEYWEDR